MLKCDETVEDLGVQLINNYAYKQAYSKFTLLKYACNLKQSKLCPLNGILLICPKLCAGHLTSYQVSHPLLVKITFMNLRLPHGKDETFPNKHRLIFNQFFTIRPLEPAMVLIGKVVLCTLRRCTGKVRTAVFITAFDNG
jgi:hypothetical protein